MEGRRGDYLLVICGSVSTLRSLTFPGLVGPIA